jgi:hypothetical protein
MRLTTLSEQPCAAIDLYTLALMADVLRERLKVVREKAAACRTPQIARRLLRRGFLDSTGNLKGREGPLETDVRYPAHELDQ